MKAMQGHPKFRIKIPRSLVVTKTHRKFHFHVKDKATTSAGANERDNMTLRTKHGNQLSSKSVGSVFRSVLGNQRPFGKYPSKEKKKHLEGESGDGKEWHITARASSNELGNNLARGGEPVVAALSQLLKLEKTLEPDRACEEKQNRKVKHRLKINLPLLSFPDKKKGWNCFIRRAKFNNEAYGDGDGAVNRFGQVRRKPSSWHVIRIRLKVLVIRLKLKMIRPLMRQKVTKQHEQTNGSGDDDKDRELCKKRILMGMRCKPLCSSGTLSYDTDGVFLPDIVP